jgi:hypothetical protein
MLDEKNVIEVLEYLQDRDISVSEYLVLLVNSKGNDVVESAALAVIPDFTQTQATLVRKGLLDRRSYARTPLANQIPGLKAPAKDFEAFWRAYPSSDKWGSWPKTRILRSNKSKTRSLYNQAVKAVGHNNLVMAVEYEVELKKKSSLMRNEMKFMPAITRWLSSARYEAVLEDLGDQEQEQSNQGPRYEGEID